MTTGKTVSHRLALPEDLDLLETIEQSAFQKFKDYLNIDEDGYTLPKSRLLKSLEENLLWILQEGETPIGFLCGIFLDGHPHIEEISIASPHQGRGLGRQFINDFLAWSKSENYPCVSLTTDSLIPWNAPFYSRLGFNEVSVENCRDELRATLLRDKEKCATPETRIGMIYNFDI